MDQTAIKKPFSHTFLGQFILAPDLLPFSDKEIKNLDTQLNQYEQLFLNPDIERNLISRNELLASFAISKAEESTLTLEEAHEVYNLILQNKEYTFIGQKLKAKQKLTQKDYEKLEFFNIAKTFRSLRQNPIHINDLTPALLKKIHKELTQGLDLFEKYLPGFTVYKSGHFRDNDTIRVGEYIPAPFKEIEKGIEELISFLKKNQNITSIGIFHTALYALHPFNNGNKRVSRILEHIFLRDKGLDSKNLYSTSYYYHKQKPRYYKYLLYSLERQNLNHFVSFFQEAIVLSIISVIKSSIDTKRQEFLERKDLETEVKKILRPLIKKHEIQFKNLFKIVKGKIARQTFVNYLQQATDEKIVIRREDGRATYYSLNVSLEEEKTFHSLLDFAKIRLAFIPDDIKLA
ncbi:MAG: Fic family protein [Candidatus Levybacteria bacterium]|nr:Fic family protein [Candidatus Levybacteria bacterium]